MIRNLKGLGLALVAVFALSALAASSASAVDKATTGTNTAIVTGVSHNNVFKITNPLVEVKCTTSVFAGTVTSGATSMTIEPTYIGTINQPSGTHSDCTGTSPAASLTINMNGCDYDLTGETTGSDTGTDATISVTCEAGKEIIITTNVGCIIKIPAQTPTSGGVTYANTPTNKVTITATSTGITYTTEGFTCVLGGLSSEANNADYTGTVIAEAFADNGGTKDGNFNEGALTTLATS